MGPGPKTIRAFRVGERVFLGQTYKEMVSFTMGVETKQSRLLSNREFHMNPHKVPLCNACTIHLMTILKAHHLPIHT